MSNYDPIQITLNVTNAAIIGKSYEFSASGGSYSSGSVAAGNEVSITFTTAVEGYNKVYFILGSMNNPVYNATILFHRNPGSAEFFYAGMSVSTNALNLNVTTPGFSSTALSNNPPNALTINIAQ